MVYKRVIPVLLLQGSGLVKTRQFRNPVYLGDPINIVKIFNEKEVDEIAILDIMATREKRGPNFGHIEEIVSEAFMPLCYGGGVTKLEEIERLFKIGIEKVSINSSAFSNPQLIKDAVSIAGSQSIIGAIDVKKNLWGKYTVHTHCGTENIKQDAATYARYLEELGVGEILINNISLDGTMQGYDLDLVLSVANAVSIPIIPCGGAGSLDDILNVLRQDSISAAAAGSFFVFQGKHKAVLITYPGYDAVQDQLNHN